jgi:predicted  nucleic acid-binding Zn-ribbon protein
MDDGDLLKAVAELTARTDKMAEQLMDKAIDFDNNASLLTAVAKLIDNNAALLKAVAELTAKVEEMAKQLGKVEEQVTWVRT